MESFDVRFKSLIQKVASNPNEFAQSLGYPKASVIYNILNGKSFPSFETIEKIKTKYPRVDINWLITGKGNMFYDTISASEEISQNRELESIKTAAFYEKLLAEKEEKITELREDKKWLKGIIETRLDSLGKFFSNLISPSEEMLSKN